MVGLACGAALTFAAAAPALAQTKSEEKFTLEITPYLWAAGIEGSYQIGNIASGGLDVSFDSIWDNLDMAVMGTIEGRHGRWGLLFDAVYFDMSQTQPTQDHLASSVKAKIEQQLYSLAPAYRVLEDEVFVDVLAGVRYLYMKGELTIAEGQHPLIAQGRQVSSSDSWWGGFVGARVAWPLPFYKPVSLVGYLDLGAMDGEFMWQGIAGVNWQISEMFTAKLGYRYMSLDVSTGVSEFDLDIGGAYAGLGIKF